MEVDEVFEPGQAGRVVLDVLTLTRTTTLQMNGVLVFLFGFGFVRFDLDWCGFIWSDLVWSGLGLACFFFTSPSLSLISIACLCMWQPTI